jgi:hypothetical protein
MKLTLHYSCAVLFCLSLPLTARAQKDFTRISLPVNFLSAASGREATPSGKKWSLPGFSADPLTSHRTANTFMSQPINTNALLGDSFWMGSVTTQSYNQGKIGRYYYWDLQGNLRGSLLFLDIAGKNKRGLKLVFPGHRAIH